MIFTDYSQHIPKITASPVCTALKNAINSIKLCLSFSQGLKIQVVYFKNAPAAGGRPPDPLPALRPCIPMGDFRPPDPLIWPQLHLLDPPLHQSHRFQNSTGSARAVCQRSSPSDEAISRVLLSDYFALIDLGHMPRNITKCFADLAVDMAWFQPSARRGSS